MRQQHTRSYSADMDKFALGILLVSLTGFLVAADRHPGSYRTGENVGSTAANELCVYADPLNTGKNAIFCGDPVGSYDVTFVPEPPDERRKRHLLFLPFGAVYKSINGKHKRHKKKHHVESSDDYDRASGGYDRSPNGYPQTSMARKGFGGHPKIVRRFRPRFRPLRRYVLRPRAVAKSFYRNGNVKRDDGWSSNVLVGRRPRYGARYVVRQVTPGRGRLTLGLLRTAGAPFNRDGTVRGTRTSARCVPGFPGLLEFMNAIFGSFNGL